MVDADSESGSDSDQSEVSDDVGVEDDDTDGSDSEQDVDSGRDEDSEQDDESNASRSQSAVSTDSESSDGCSYHDLVGGEEGEVAAITAPESTTPEIPDSDFVARDDLLLYATQSDLFLVRVTTFEHASAQPSETSEPANVPAPRVSVEHRIRGVCDGTLTVYRALHRLCHVEIIQQLGIVLVASSASDQVTMLVVTRCVPFVASWRFCSALAR